MVKKIQKTIHKMWKICLDLLYPPVCPLCSTVLRADEKLVCRACKASLPYINSPYCLKCGKEIFREEDEFCEDCKELSRTYIRGFPAMRYEGRVKDSLMDFKYHNRREYADFFACEIVKRHGKSIVEMAPEVLVPVPVHWAKRRRRGYNQAELLAKGLSDYLNIPVDSGLIQRRVNTMPQKKLDPAQRENNLKKAFLSAKNIVKYDCVMLVDDIYTTGATVEACTKVLRDMGIHRVYYTSVCIGKGN